jgi:hypothetical protein
MKRKAILLAVVLALLLTSAAQAMHSANYALDWLAPLTSGGGGEASSAHYSINYSVGQSAIGAASSTHYISNLGFWQVFARYLRLPLVLK